MIKMLNQNMTQRGTQATGLGVMIGRCSLDSQHGRYDRHPANVGCSFSGTHTTNFVITRIRDFSRENGLEKTTNLHFTVILETTLHKKGVEKE